MKKKLVLTLSLTALLLSIAFALTDLEGHWAKTYIDDLIAKNAINGYGDGTFRPESTITTGEFTKLLVAALGHDEGNADTGHWASNYLVKAKSLGLIKADESEYNALDNAINRGMMARMIARALDEDYNDMLKYKRDIKDYNALLDVNKSAVLKTYRAGIITGYPDGTFKDGNFATRAEASTMLAKLLNSSYRNAPAVSSSNPKDSANEDTNTTKDNNSAGDTATDDTVYGTPERLARLEKEYGYIWDYDLKEDTYLDNGLNIQESTAEDEYEYLANVTMFSPLEPQHEALELYLSKWYDQEGINKIMHSVKKKKIRFQAKVFDELLINNRYTLVNTPKNGSTLAVVAFYDEKIDTDKKNTNTSKSNTVGTNSNLPTDDIIYGTPERLARLEKEYGYIWDYDLKEDTYLDNGLNIEESTAEDEYDYVANVTMFSPLEPQHEALELYLSKWYDQEGINKIMHSVKKKKTRFQAKVFDELLINGKYTLVKTPNNGPTLAVVAFYEEKIGVGKKY